MEKGCFNNRIICFDPSMESESKHEKRTVYHYTSPAGLMAILRTPSIRFTDCEYLNDKSEYNHIHIPLEKAFEEVRENLYDSDFPDLIEHYIENGYDYPTFVTEKPELGFKGLKFVNMRHFVFCASTENDSLGMWNYYVRGGNYQGYNLGLSVKSVVRDLSDKIGDNVKLFYGRVIYNDKEKLDILKKIIIKVDEDLHIALKKYKEPEEYELTKQEYYGNLLSYIENCRLFFKDAAFLGEKEFRFVLRLPTSQSLYSKYFFKISYDMKNGVMTPYCDMKLEKSGTIKKITISPMIETQLAKSGLERFLNDNEYDSKINIDNSAIPIRY